MKRNFKRTLSRLASSLLALSMTVSLFPAAVGAAEAEIVPPPA